MRAGLCGKCSLLKYPFTVPIRAKIVYTESSK
jgi:hypothetical protein